jgi:hypothetical protein
VITGPSAVPDLVRPVIGFRQWRLHDGGLHSMWADDRWERGELRACCRGAGREPVEDTGAAPHPDCTCGVHAWHRQVPLGASATRELVAGAVALSGAIEVHATGMRGQCARIVALALPVTRGRKRLELAIAAGELGIDLVPHGLLVAAAMAHGTPVPTTLRPARWSGAQAPTPAL